MEEVSDWDAEHSENGIEPKATVGSQTTSGYKTRREMIAEESCDKAKQRLLSLGQCLDLITPKERWRTDPNTQEVWKPTYRDDWIEESLNIRTKIGGSTLIRLNPVQREYSRVCLEAGSKRNIVLKARQVGMTSYIAARFFVQTITKPGTLTMLVAHDRLSAEEIFRIVHRFWDNLSTSLRTGPLRTSHSSARELVFPVMDSGFTVTSADENAGRGRTIQNLHCTEVSRWGNDAADALGSLRAAGTPEGETVLESTANGAWGPFYQEWQQAEETGYRRHFFPWWFESSYRCAVGSDFVMTAEETTLAAAHGLAAEQIAWRRRQWSSMRGLALQEFAEDAVTCFKASGECMFEMEVIEKALAALRGPVSTTENGRLSIWLQPARGVQYVIGADPAGGGARGDYSCAQVIDNKEGMQCAELHGHYTPREFANRICKLAKEYNDAELAVERNNHGHAVLMHLDTLKYGHVFHEGGLAGWNTTAASRPPMIETLGEMLVEKPGNFQSVKLWNECRTFVRAADGRPGAGVGSHDDCVIAMAIAQAVRAEMAGWKGQREPR